MALGGAECLLVRPHAVDLSVMQVECWVAWRGEEISAWVAIDGEMSAAMGADFNRIGNAFENGAKCGEVVC